MDRAVVKLWEDLDCPLKVFNSSDISLKIFKEVLVTQLRSSIENSLKKVNEKLGKNNEEKNNKKATFKSSFILN